MFSLYIPSFFLEENNMLSVSFVLGLLAWYTILRQQVEVMEGAWGSWGMLGGKGFEPNGGGGVLVLWCIEEVRSNVAVRRAGSQNQISQLPTFDKSGEGPARHRGRTQPASLKTSNYILPTFSCQSQNIHFTNFFPLKNQLKCFL